MKLEEVKNWVKEFFRSPWKTLGLIIVLLISVSILAYVSTFVGEKAKQHATTTAPVSPIVAPPNSSPTDTIPTQKKRLFMEGNTFHITTKGGGQQFFIKEDGVAEFDLKNNTVVLEQNKPGEQVFIDSSGKGSIAADSNTVEMKQGVRECRTKPSTANKNSAPLRSAPVLACRHLLRPGSPSINNQNEGPTGVKPH